MSEQDHAHARAADSLLEYYVNSGLSSFPDALSWNWFATTLQLARCCFKSSASGEAFTGNSGAAGRMWCSFIALAQNPDSGGFRMQIFGR